ncbi:hypothetical protein KE480_15675 [Enterococcus sp. 079]|nr:hypothetical protein [Enterococcus sp. 079]
MRQESAQLVKDIADLQERIEKREDTIQKQAREAQVSNTSSNYIDAVLNADSLADAIGRVQAMTTMVKANNDLMEQQKQDKKAVEDKKAENDAKLKELAENQAALESQKAIFYLNKLI